MIELSKINPCITPKMEKFLEIMTEIAESYRITDLNEYLGTCDGKFKITINEVKKRLEEKLKVINLNIKQRENGNYDITGFVEGEIMDYSGEYAKIGGKPTGKKGGKEVYISNIKEV